LKNQRPYDPSYGLPLTASGKVKKFELREQLIKELGLEDVARLKTA